MKFELNWGKFELNWPSGIRGEDVENVDGLTDGRQMDAGVTGTLLAHHEISAQVS